ncbi:hypothetical protein [Virgibacillus phasianinus]|nr:hypothetical protein [Virgibacillus phasianinus]
MKKIGKGFAKFIVANLAVILVILLLPIFLVTDDVAIFDQVMSFLFNSKG